MLERKMREQSNSGTEQGQNGAGARAGAPQVVIGRDGEVALLRLSHRPGNQLGLEMRRALLEAIEHADSSEEIKAIVLMGDGPSFCTGFAPQALVGVEKDPSLNMLCDRIERCSKPVVASLHGITLEAGLALALAAHYRVMGRSAHLGAPEVTFGLVPTGGVTQRLPRLIGARPALEILLSGRTLAGPQAEKLGLVDTLAANRAGEAAIAFAHRCVTEGRGPRPSRDVMTGIADGAGFLQEINSRREAIRNVRIAAPGRIIDCVEAALMLPFEAGVQREDIAREDSFATEDAQALRHAFLAEERVARLRHGEGAEPQEIEAIGLIGAGSLALGVALSALDHGIEVRMIGADPDQLVHAEQRIANAYTRAVQQGQMTEEIRAARLAAFSAGQKLGVLTDVQLVLDATGGTVEARGRMLARVEEFMAQDAVLATVADRGFAGLAQALAHPERFLGLHVFMPSQAIRVIELARPSGVTPEAVATAHGFVRELGKIPVVVRARDGLVANVVQEAAWSAVDVLLLMGARPARIDRVMRDYGFPVGPCEVMDALGLDNMTGAVAQFLAGEGRRGKAAGQGFYDYVDETQGSDEAAEAILADLRQQGGVAAITVSDQDIVDRIILAEANAGARLLQAGIVERPDEIDVVMMLAKGFPRFHGGPMQAADRMGILRAENRLKSFAPAAPDIWEPATIWREFFKNGDNFEKLNLL
ncbi:3-hydroxyacyl-CoA dehydrogenase NAD-binding domain-containing protein [Celeribacter neptunius]|uniref:3-hydroxyacyl-CoA dehydrogenase n=1 Tax=Celeribacter neptunius TaxID=588602 RepID=A0A1I3M4A9_9RHOB|nr:3-hydroxyacyl-CoA dehydrogenase NAD-binding domain-containing protein [Celeribacter neptunius]SFI91575.1 3-hydroxyacyl-CoA dehydrogenase [Celeribacter neptunius]